MATESWTVGQVYQESAFADVIYEKEADSPFIALASQEHAGTSAEQWAADYLAGVQPCGATEPVTIDGAVGVLAADCGHALVSVGDRGYLIWLYRIDDLAWFRQILDTVQLDPRPPLIGTLSSDLHGISVSVPAGWSIRQATQNWATGTPRFDAAFIDTAFDETTDNLRFISAASQPLAGRTGDEWVTALSTDPGWEGQCPAQTAPVTVDGASGLLLTFCPGGFASALVATADRGYVITLYGVGDLGWFEEILATVTLQPERAVTAASASP